MGNEIPWINQKWYFSHSKQSISLYAYSMGYTRAVLIVIYSCCIDSVCDAIRGIGAHMVSCGMQWGYGNAA